MGPTLTKLQAEIHKVPAIERLLNNEDTHNAGQASSPRLFPQPRSQVFFISGLEMQLVTWPLTCCIKMSLFQSSSF